MEGKVRPGEGQEGVESGIGDGREFVAEPFLL